MTDLQILSLKLDALADFMMANTRKECDEAKRRMRELHSITARKKQHEQDADKIIRGILFEMGVREHLVGFQYIVDAVLICVDDPMAIKKLSSGEGLYFKVAQNCDTSAPRVERGIRFVVDNIFLKCDQEILYRYFGNSIDPGKGKATNGEFLARMDNVVRQKLREQ